jgi:hypothetical protein
MANGELFDKGEAWHDEWVGMPEFVQENLKPNKSIRLHFETEADMIAFSKLVEQKVLPDTRSIWYPPARIDRYANKRWIDASEQVRIDFDQAKGEFT